MTYEEASKFRTENEQILNYNNKGFIITNLIVFPAQFDYPDLLSSARLLREQEIEPQQTTATEYEVFVLYDLQDWLYDKPLPYQTLSSLLWRLNH